MFAVAAVAALSLGVAPMQEAFAWSSTGTQVMYTTSPTQGNSNNDPDSKSICGQTTNANLIVTNNDPYDRIYIYYNFNHCSDWEKIVFQANVNGGSVEHTFTEYNNASGAQIFSETFGSSGGDTVQATVSYYW